MTIHTTEIEGLLVIEQPTHADDRGFFRQTYVMSELAEALGRRPEFVQGNHARSEPGVLRGFHAEPWDKLIYVPRGRVLSVIADIRPASATFGRTLSFPMGDDEQRIRLFVSAGLGNSYCVLGNEPSDHIYSVTVEWHQELESRSVVWNDPTLAVDWPLSDPLLSVRDAAAPTLRELHPDHDLFTGGHP